MKKEINVFDYAEQILKSTKKGILVTTKSDDKVNSMVVSWGTLGVEWGREIFTVFVRENRFTKSQLDKNPEFTINIPLEQLDKNIMLTCGSKSGHDIDKIENLGLTLIAGEKVSVPAIKEVPLTLECRVIYKQLQDRNEINNDDFKKYYPQDVESDFYGANKDLHIAYYGEIVNAYIILDK